MKNQSGLWCNAMFIYNFADGVVRIFFEKEGATEKKDFDFIIEDWDTYTQVRKFHTVCLLFIVYLVTRIIAFKSSLELCFIPWLLNYFYLPSHGSKSRKWYKLRLFTVSMREFWNLLCLRGKLLSWGKSLPVEDWW